MSLVLNYKYRIGDVFFDSDRNEIVEITGFNSVLGDNVYKGLIRADMGYGTRCTLESNMIYQARLDSMKKYESVKAVEVAKMVKSQKINYVIYYFDTPMKKGQNAIQIQLKLSGIRKLAEVLNKMKAKNPNRRITMVTVVDDDGRYVDYVKFLKVEWAKQKWLTGYKERLLANAKYERGFEIATGF